METKPRSAEESRVILSSELFAGGKTVLIRHDNGVYRLMITKQGKLILTK